MADDTYTPRLKERFRAELVPQLQKEHGYGNVMQVARPEKIIMTWGWATPSRTVVCWTLQWRTSRSSPARSRCDQGPQVDRRVQAP